MYVRAEGNDVMTAAAKVFGEVKQINKADSPANEVAFTTEKLSLAEFTAKIAELESNDVKVLSKIRIGDL